MVPVVHRTPALEASPGNGASPRLPLPWPERVTWPCPVSQGLRKVTPCLAGEKLGFVGAPKDWHPPLVPGVCLPTWKRSLPTHPCQG